MKINLSKKIGASGLVVGGGAVVGGLVGRVVGEDKLGEAVGGVGVVVGVGLVVVVGGGVVTAVIDKYVNQNITNNKVAQYGLTALEGLLVAPTVGCISILPIFKPIYGKFLEGLCRNYPCQDIVISSIIFSALMFKFIWGLENSTTDDITTPELDLVEMDEDSTNTIFDTEAPIDSSDGYQVF